MTRKKALTYGALATIVGCAQMIFAQAPVVNIGSRHGNLRAAQSYIVQAFQKLDLAQQDNRYRLGGHAGKAKELLIQADKEIRMAADEANRGGR
jgi:hypothetical protein